MGLPFGLKNSQVIEKTFRFFFIPTSMMSLHSLLCQLPPFWLSTDCIDSVFVQ